jgi:hypothetical protein
MDIKNPISVERMFYNILCKTSEYGRALRIVAVEGDIVGVPFYPNDDKGFRNLLNRAIVLAGDDDRPSLRVIANAGTLSPAFTPGSHDGMYKILNSLFVNVEQPNGEVVVAVNLFVTNPFWPEPTQTPTPTP